jgi:hypothetical protein
MPVQPCSEDGKPGYKWGDVGKCYVYTPGNDDSRDRAKARAERQGRAARASGYTGIQKNESWHGEELYDKLPDDERKLADSLMDLYTEIGPFDEAEGVWVGYMSAEDNPDNEIGVNCGNCVLHDTDKKCMVLSQEIEMGGMCRFAVIPPGYVQVRTRKWNGNILPTT